MLSPLSIKLEEVESMSLELMRETIKVNQVIGEDTIQTIVENDIIVPDVKPDIARILLLDGDAFVEGTEVMQDKVLVNGNICFKILYFSDEASNCVKSMNPSLNFSYGLDIPNARHGMKSNVKCDIEHIEYSILNGRKVNIKTIVKIGGSVVDEIDTEMVCDIKGSDNIQVLKSSTGVNCYLGSNDAGFTVKDSMEIPAGKPSVRDILRSDIKFTGKDYKISDNKVIAKGDLNLLTLYIADDEEQSIQFIEHEIPFTQFIDLPGINEDSGCDVDFRVTGSQVAMAEDSDGELRVLNAEIGVDISVTGYSKRSIEVIDDAYSPRLKLDLEKKPFRIKEIVTESKGQVVVKDSIIVQDDSPDIAEVFNVLCKPVLTDCSIFDDRIVVEGLVVNNVLFLANDAEQPISCYKQETPFKHSVDVRGLKPDMSCDVNLDIEHYNYSMVSASEVEVRLVLCLGLKVVNHLEIPLIVKVNEHPLDEKRIYSQPSITIYFSQPGDTLWEIAKKYCTTVDDIKCVNNLAGRDSIDVGQQIIIPRKLV